MPPPGDRERQNGRWALPDGFVHALNELKSALHIKAAVVDKHTEELKDQCERIDSVKEALHGTDANPHTGLVTRVMLIERDRASEQAVRNKEQDARDRREMAVIGAVLAVIGKLLYDVFAKQ